MMGIDGGLNADAPLEVSQRYWVIRAAGGERQDAVSRFMPSLGQDEAMAQVMNSFRQASGDEHLSVEDISGLVDALSPGEPTPPETLRREQQRISSSQSREATWSVYRDATSRFSISFPERWTVKPGGGEGTLIKSVLNEGRKRIRLFAVWRMELPLEGRQLTIDDLSHDQLITMTTSDGTVVEPSSVKHVRTDHHDAVRMAYSGSTPLFDLRGEQWLLFEGGFFWRIYGSWTGADDSWASVQDEFRRIAKTFKVH